MHIDESTHENGSTGKVYRYEADYSIAGEMLQWTGVIRQGDGFSQTIGGTIPVTFPAAAALAVKLVHDAIVKEIDAAQA